MPVIKKGVSGKAQQLAAQEKNESRKEKILQFITPLNAEQKEAKKQILNSDVVVLFGKAGSGKTFLACNAALTCLSNSAYPTKKIYITRPTVSREELGFLPGDLKDKMDPWVKPIYHNFEQNITASNLKTMMDKKEIEISPISFMRGITYQDSFVIVDEVQNVTVEQMKMIITRLGKGSKMILCGDISQIDLKNTSDSGLNYLINIGKNITPDEEKGILGFSIIELTSNHRHGIVEFFIKKIEEIENEELERKKTKGRRND